MHIEVSIAVSASMFARIALQELRILRVGSSSGTRRLRAVVTFILVPAKQILQIYSTSVFL